MVLHVAIDFARRTDRSVLTTIRNDSRPQLSNVTHGVDGAGVVRVSTTTRTAKYTNLTRRPWAALHISSPDFWSYVVLECDATLSPVAADTHDATVEELVDLYRSVKGEHPDWDDYRAVMVRDQRVVARFTPVRAYGYLAPGAPD